MDNILNKKIKKKEREEYKKKPIHCDEVNRQGDDVISAFYSTRILFGSVVSSSRMRPPISLHIDKNTNKTFEKKDARCI